jgi:Flp pilus assembly protein TadD
MRWKISWTFGLVLLGSSLGWAEDQREQPSGGKPSGVESKGVQPGGLESTSAATILQWIAQLGDQEYQQRQRAEAELLALGVEAFPFLQAAEQDADLEIALRAKYLRKQIHIEWAKPTDSAAVRSIMAGYGALPKTKRLAKVGQLAQLPQEQGFAPLCRIAKFEAAGQVARFAALAILEKGFLPEPRVAEAVAVLKEELDGSQVVPAVWVGVYVAQLESPEQMLPRWTELLDRELELAAESTLETTRLLATALVNSYLNLSDERSDTQAILAGLECRMRLQTRSEKQMPGALAATFLWILDHQQWAVLEPLEKQYAQTIREGRLLSYLLALSRDRQGRREEAAELADRALQLEAAEPDEHNQIAVFLGDLGRHDWAEREWQLLVDTLPAADFQSLVARNSLATYCLHDRGANREAADLLGAALSAIDADVAAQSEVGGSFLRNVRGNRHYYLACHYQSVHKLDEQRRQLDLALQFAPENADVLIAMYRLEGASKAYRQDTLQKIDQVQRAMEQVIRQSPRDAQGYNQWAWLISNTEGDFAKAVQYSQRSLELEPGSASYLDTLGRCYYAAGELEKAVSVQREAITKHPHLQVMQRQLALFESALQQKK